MIFAALVLEASELIPSFISSASGIKGAVAGLLKLAAVDSYFWNNSLSNLEDSND